MEIRTSKHTGMKYGIVECVVCHEDVTCDPDAERVRRYHEGTCRQIFEKSRTLKFAAKEAEKRRINEA